MNLSIPSFYQNSSLYFNRQLVFSFHRGRLESRGRKPVAVHLNQSAIQDLISVWLPQTMGSTCVCVCAASQLTSTIDSALHLPSEKPTISTTVLIDQ